VAEQDAINMATDFSTYYPQNPWQGVTTKERTPWYYRELYSEFRRRAVYNRFVGMEFNHNGPKASELVISSLIMPHANHDPIGVRDMWLNSSFMDTFNRKIHFSRYAGKMSLNRFDNMISFFLRNNVGGLKHIINEGLGSMMTNQMDKLARDAFLKSPYALYGDGSGGWGGTGFNNINASDMVTTELLEDINLGAKERDVPLVQDENGGLGGEIVCITTPGVVRDLRFEASATGNANAFIDVKKYQQGRQIIAGEVGSYHGTRFVVTNNAILYNAGAIVHQSAITSAILAGDGAPDPGSTAVDSVEYVGQPDATHYIAVNDASGFSIGDIVTIHVDRSDERGVPDGLDYSDGKAQHRRVVDVDNTGNTITLERPILEDFKTILSPSVYGYVTKARHIHTMLNITGPNGVVMGVAQPPRIHVPRPVDDLDMIYRVNIGSALAA
jgi:hypothetical protein